MEVKRKNQEVIERTLAKTQFGSVFKYENMYYMVTDSYNARSISCVNIETGQLRTFDDSTKVCALKAEVTIDD